MTAAMHGVLAICLGAIRPALGERLLPNDPSESARHRAAVKGWREPVTSDNVLVPATPYAS
jgi:hypothetical protein